MVWSPLAGGKVFNENNDQANRVKNILYELAGKYNVEADVVALSWLLIHPVNFVIVLGSGKIERIKSAMNALNVNISREDWFKIWVASKGNDIP